MALSHSIRELLTLKSLTQEVIDNLVIDCEKLKFVSRSTIHEDNKEAIVMATSPRTTPKSKHIAFKYIWCRQNVRKEFVIRKIESENQKTDILQRFTRSNICKDKEICYAADKPSDERECSEKLHLQSYLDMLWSKTGYFGLLRNNRILFIILLYIIKR